MLLDVVKKTRGEIETYQRSLSQQNQVQDIRNTRNELMNIQPMLDQICDTFEVLRASFNPNELNNLITRIESLQFYLRNSQNHFIQKSDYKQAPSIGLINTSIKSLSKEIEQSWIFYAQALTQPYDELAKIAVTLPQMQEHMNTISQLLSQLNQSAKSLPNKKKWTDFHIKLEELSNLLSVIEGLDPDKVAFLNKIRNREATISDFTPELLRWCTEIGLAGSLSVRFKNDAS